MVEKILLYQKTLMNIGNYEYDDVLNQIIVDREERYPEILD